MNKKVKMLVLGYITIAQFTVLSSSVIANANELQGRNIAEVVKNADNKADQYTDAEAVVEENLDKSQIVNIPDEGLRRILLRELGLNEEDNITINQLETITELNVNLSWSDCIKITDLTGLEYCKNLTKFICSTSEISDLTPLAGAVELKEIDLRYNNISDITPLENLTKLEVLTLNNNKISNIGGLENLTNLKELNLACNNISDINALKNLTNLKALYLYGNKITDIGSLANLYNLEYLSLDNNNISDITALINLINLKSLNLNNNNISDISPMKNLTNLKSVYLYNNKIKDIGSLVNLYNLEYLNLSNNSIIDIDPLKNLIDLRGLYLDNNNISDISPIEKLIDLDELALNNNNISEISSIGKLNKLYRLSLSDNKIKNIDALENSIVDILSLNNNEIQDISVLSTCKNLRILELGGNNISDISMLSELNYLTSLSLENNNISDISCISNFRILNNLYISNNKISDISALENRLLQRLEINNNPITNLDLSKDYAYNIYIDIEQQKYINNYEESYTRVNLVLDPIKLLGNSIKIKNPIEYIGMDKVVFDNATYIEEDDTLLIDNINITSMNEIYVSYWTNDYSNGGEIIIPIEKEPELDDEINIDIPDQITDIIDTTIVTPVSGNGSKENPLVLEAKEVSVDKVKELLNSFDEANVACEEIENDGTYTKYKFKVVNTITRDLDETYFTIIVANSQKDIIDLLNDHYEIKNDDVNNGNGSGNGGNDSDNNGSDSGNGGNGSDNNGSDSGNGEATEDNLNKEDGTTNDSIIVKPENNINQNTNNKVESNTSKLPVTGQAVASSLYVALGTALTGIGALINRKKKVKK